MNTDSNPTNDSEEQKPISQTLLLITEAYEPCIAFIDADVKQDTTQLWHSLQKQRPDLEVDTDMLFNFMEQNGFKQRNINGSWVWLLKLKGSGFW